MIEKTKPVGPRAIFKITLIGIALLLCLPFHGLWRLFGLASPWPRMFLSIGSRAAGLRIKIVGKPITRNVLFVANHVSWLDIFAVAGTTSSAFVAKADMAPWPVIGWLATLNNSVYVAREDRLNVAAQASAIQIALATGQALTLFPEGTTANGRELLPFRSSLLAAVAPPPPGISIQPIAIDYGKNASFVAWTEAESVGVNAFRVLGRPGGLDVTLHFMAPLDLIICQDRKTIAAQCRIAISTALFGADTHR